MEPVTIIPDVGHSEKCRYFMVQHKKSWPELFVKWVKDPHGLDEMVDEYGDAFNDESTEEEDGDGDDSSQ